MTNPTAVTQPARTEETSFHMLPTDQHIHVRHRIDSLVEAAAAERAAARQRRAHRAEHAVHPDVGHTHEPNAVRRALGRALIGLGSAIAGSPGAGARRAA